jgi:hypothetical protein
MVDELCSNKAPIGFQAGYSNFQKNMEYWSAGVLAEWQSDGVSVIQ